MTDGALKRPTCRNSFVILAVIAFDCFGCFSGCFSAVLPAVLPALCPGTTRHLFSAVFRLFSAVGHLAPLWVAAESATIFTTSGADSPSPKTGKKQCGVQCFTGN